MSGVTWQTNRTLHRLDAELHGDALACLYHVEEPDDGAALGGLDVISLPAGKLEEVESLLARLRAQRDRQALVGQLLLFPTKAAA